MSLTYYALLGVPVDANESTIKSAFRSAQRASHPDTSGWASATQFALVTEAGEVLLDPARRASYDAELAAADAPTPTPEPEPAVDEPADDDWGWGTWGDEAPADTPPVGEVPEPGLAPADTIWDYLRRGAIRALILSVPMLVAAVLLGWAGRSAPSATALAPLVGALVLGLWASRRTVRPLPRRLAVATVLAVVVLVWSAAAPGGFLTVLALGACSLVPLSPFVARYVLEEVLQ